MTSWVTKTVATIAFMAMASTAFAQQTSTNRVNSNTDWSVFVEDNPTQCWIVAPEKESVVRRNGVIVAANRDDIRLFVSFWPDRPNAAEVSFTGGYTFKSGSTVSMEIGNASFELFTDGNLAWAASPADDAKIITAMKRGAEAVVTGTSSRNGVTRDTFSLLGFTASYDDAARRCSS